jgi:site-specific DNA recombinase
VPYGEKFNTPPRWSVKLEPSDDDDKLATVRWLFETFANTDCSLRWMAKELNRRGIPAPRGKGWNSNTVRYVLTHRVYLGNQGFGERRGGKYYRVGDDGEIEQANGKPTTRRAPIVVEKAHEPLVDIELFERVQEKLADRATNNTKARTSDYLLTGVLKCGHCGRSLCGQSGSKTSKTPRRYYRCPGGNDGRCKLYAIRKESIEGYVLGFLDKWLKSPESIAAIKAAIHRLEKAKQRFHATAASLQTKIAALDRKIAKGSENLLLADAANVPELSELLGQWRKERERLQADLERAAVNPNDNDPGKIARRAIARMGKMQESLQAGDPALVRAAVKQLVPKQA